MKISIQQSPGIVVVGIAVGSFTGALLRAAALLVLPNHPDSPLIPSLLLSLLGGAFLGALLGIALQRGSSSVWRSLLLVALIAAIGSFGAGAAMQLDAKDATQWPYWRDAALNIGVTVLTARAAVLLVRPRNPR